ncbi:hypothetical protein [Nostoc sp.]
MCRLFPSLQAEAIAIGNQRFMRGLVVRAGLVVILTIIVQLA